ncbi:PEGA domain-containing protein [Pseudenhygromyxa sp. WMMC2535]|uniref:PEGA domain-containing protein n=1 Tax=Pseudenhygromyxa sp. WMMC2535 TaxID=2712867 RepID=UPI001553C1B0|nr:PEGA domain-containing protein [Pseudenhygromyxa sp. WMMC2535]
MSVDIRRPRARRPARLGRGLLVCVLALAAGSVVASATGCAHGRAAKSREAPASVLEIVTETTDADVWVDGEYIGQVAAVSGRLELGSGVHRVEIRKPGHFPVQRTVSVDKKGGGVVSVAAELLEDPR